MASLRYMKNEKIYKISEIQIKPPPESYRKPSNFDHKVAFLNPYGTHESVKQTKTNSRSFLNTYLNKLSRGN